MKNKLRQLITKEIPEILELKRGCYLSTKKYNNLYIGYADEKGACICGDFNEFRDYDFIKRFTKIIGREITLADVLRVIFKRKNEVAREFPMYLNCCNDGAFYSVEYTYPDGNKCVIEHKGLAKWNLEETLEEQEPETISFLYNLLK